MQLAPAFRSLQTAFKSVTCALMCSGLLAACTSSSMGPGPAPEAANTAPATPPSASKAANGSDRGPLDQRGGIKVALLLPLTGAPGTIEIGKALRQAGELALLEFDNPNIVMSTKDTKGTAEGARAAAEEAVQGGAEIIIGPLFAKEVQTVTPVARKANVPVIAFSSDKSVAGNGTYLLSFLAGQDVPRIVAYAASQGKRNFAALVPEGAYGKIVEAAFRDAVQASGGRVIAVHSFPINANGMLDPVKKIAEAAKTSAQAGAPLDALFVPAGQDALPIIAPLLPYNDIDTRQVKLLGSSDWDFQNVGREAALMGGWFAAPDPRGWTDFSQRYAKTYGGVPPRIASLSYDAVSLAVSLSGNPQGQRFTEANLTRVSGFSGIDGLFRWRANGMSERGLAILEVQKFGATVVDPAVSSFAGPQVTASGGGAPTSGLAPQFNLFGGN